LFSAIIVDQDREHRMKDQTRTNQELIEEISGLRHKIRELEQSESERKSASEALRKSEEYFRAITQHSSDIIFILDRQGTISYASPSVERFLGCLPDELIGKKSLDLILSDDQPKAVDDFSRALLTKEIVIPNVFRIRHRDGTERILEGFGKNLLDNPVVAGFVMNVRDVTERRQADEALRKSEERYRELVEKATDVVFRTDATGCIIFVNPSMIHTTGYTEEEILGRHYTILLRPDMRDEAIKFFGRQFVKGIQNTYSEFPMVTKEGREVWFGQNTQLIIENGAVTGFQVVARDITERKRMEEALRESENRYRELSIIDGLTQLYNSRHFYFQLKIELDRSNRYEQPLTLLLLDLDNFKAFNDTYGHVEGDQVLYRLGQVVKKCLRETDFACRYGGEEFTIILPMTTSADGAFTAERIRTEFKKEIFSPEPGQEIHVTVSIGIAQYKPQEEMKAFVHRVDQLMYQGKKNGKDKVCCES
jgi:diguanylate cyclase (GGDEF)-like protein/PAS domain S-box-containing protein